MTVAAPATHAPNAAAGPVNQVRAQFCGIRSLWRDGLLILKPEPILLTLMRHWRCRVLLSVKHGLVHTQILPQAENELFNNWVRGALLWKKQRIGKA